MIKVARRNRKMRKRNTIASLILSGREDPGEPSTKVALVFGSRSGGAHLYSKLERYRYEVFYFFSWA